MKPLLVTLLKRKSVSLLLCAFLACDTLDGDEIKPENKFKFSQTEFYILPFSSTVIDLKAIIEKSFVSVSLTIAENPSKGTLTRMDDFIMKYTPYEDFIDGKDQFIISAVLDDGTTINSKPMIIHMKSDAEEFPCGVYAVEGNIRMDSANTAVIRVLENDRICDVDEPVDVIIHLPPKFGEAVAVGNSIIYTPGPTFSKTDEFVYSLSTSNGEEVSLGLVSFNKSKFEIFDIPLGFTNIFFVDDMIGFIAGGQAIQKTIDGGRNWIQLTYPTHENDFINFEDIFFLDKDIGFAAFYECPWSGNVELCPGGWMTTKNGGLTWDRFDLNNAVNSIMFTSPLIGYISTYSQWFDLGGPTYRSVFKTLNGGETWDQVDDLYSSTFGKIKLKFATESVGYAYESSSISSTTDGGKTWKPFFTDANVTSFALASDNVICASVVPAGAGFSGTIPSAIFRSENGSPFQVAINFPYTILSQGFSPEGDLGVAIGISEAKPPFKSASQILTISISTDTGKSWVDLDQHPDGFPWTISVPSENTAYILCSGKIIKYSP